MAHSRFIAHVLALASAMLLVCAQPVIAAADCPPATSCVADDHAAGGVPDGHFAADAAALLAATATPEAPTAPQTRSPTSTQNEDGPGAAIFNPFTSVQDRQTHAAFFPIDANVAPLAIAVGISLLVTLAGVAAFALFTRNRGN